MLALFKKGPTSQLRCLQVLHVLAALNLPELLHSGPKTAEELAPLAGEPVRLCVTAPLLLTDP